ncbi:hypothetical protein TNCV_1157051 [Trichonephila clavipes]|nr:hypothetical protein TNCV_1157051 [Trichonephila clavipes]
MDKCVQLWTRNYGALGQTARVCFGVLCANRTREVKRDFGDLPIRRDEGRVVNTPLVFKRVLFQERKKRRSEEKDEKRPGERKKKVGRGGRGNPGERTDGRSGEESEREEKRRGRKRRTSRVRERERTEGVRDWSEKDDERRWR